jgi:hypothetical protein
MSGGEETEWRDRLILMVKEEKFLIEMEEEAVVATFRRQKKLMKEKKNTSSDFEELNLLLFHSIPFLLSDINLYVFHLSPARSTNDDGN